MTNTAKVSGLVFDDNNINGQFDNGDNVVTKGVTVQLLDTEDNVLQTTVTNTEGQYEFDNLAAGQYKVKFLGGLGINYSPINVGDDTTDSDVDQTGTTEIFTLEQGQSFNNVDAGCYKTALIGDRVFEDTNQNGIQDAGEDGVSNVTVELLNLDGEILQTTSSDQNGEYSFTGLLPGNYRVSFDKPDGFEGFSNKFQGEDTAQDSNVNPNGVTDVIGLDVGEEDRSVDAGLIKTAAPVKAKIGNKVFNDLDNDGIQDAGEPGIARAEVFLLDTDGNIVDSTLSNSQGNYRFFVDPGSYRVKVPVPEGFDDYTLQNQGRNDRVDSDFNPNLGTSHVVTVAAGEKDNTVDVGFVKSPVIEKAKIGNKVFNDLDRDGIRDIGEPGIADAEVFLLDTDGNIVDSTLSNSQGSYRFFVDPGSYRVKVPVPEGFDDYTLQNQGTNDRVDSDFNPNLGTSHVVTVASGEKDNTVDVGFVINDNPRIDIEKFVNGTDAEDASEFPALKPGDNVTFTYKVSNTGNVAFAGDEVVVTDDNGTANNFNDDFNPNFVSGDNGNNLLDPGETWIYSATDTVQNLTNSIFKQAIFVFGGHTPLDGHDGNVRTFSVDGISVEVSAFSHRKGSNRFNQAYVGAYNGGLGITNPHESIFAHRVDNRGSIDYLVFEFDTDVVVDKALLRYVGHDSDISIWIGDTNGSNLTSIDNDLLNSFTKENNFTHSDRSRIADVNSQELVGDTLIISAYTDGSNDSFKLQALGLDALIGNSSDIYQNVATVNAGTAFDSDFSGYTNDI